jgi:hypothetical protein
MPSVEWFTGNEKKLGCYSVPVDINTEWRHCRIFCRDEKIFGKKHANFAPHIETYHTALYNVLRLNNCDVFWHRPLLGDCV